MNFDLNGTKISRDEAKALVDRLKTYLDTPEFEHGHIYIDEQYVYYIAANGGSPYSGEVVLWRLHPDGGPSTVCNKDYWLRHGAGSFREIDTPTNSSLFTAMHRHD